MRSTGMAALLVEFNFDDLKLKAIKEQRVDDVRKLNPKHSAAQMFYVISHLI
jgi:hypothetical protein